MSKMCTENYDAFYFIPQNRKINEKLVKKKEAMFKTNNLFHLNPMIVTPDFGIIDGQHRYVAAKRMGVALWFEINHEWRPEDLISMNNNSDKWGPDDFVNFYAKGGNKNYIAIQKLMKLHRLGAGFVLTIVGRKSSGRNKTSFRDGVLNDFDVRRGDETLQKRSAVLNLLVEKMGYDWARPYTGVIFARALCVLLAHEAISFGTLMDKMELNMQKLRPCTTQTDYMTILLQIYNYRARTQITMQDFK